MSDIASAPLQSRRGDKKEGNMSRIRHIAVVTSNQEKLGNFYKTAFGMKEVKGIGSALYLSDGYMNLALIKKTPELKVDEGLYHFGFEVDDVEPLKDIFKEVGASSEVQRRPTDRDAEFRVYDPDGNPIDLVCSRKWPV
jgi:catechol 2,3-dioxygenase-like lactoylglutathione lyase family enzyme